MEKQVILQKFSLTLKFFSKTMKKTKIFSIFALMTMLLGTFFMYSCSKSTNEVDPSTPKSSTKNNKSGSARGFVFLGNLHNSYMTEASTNFVGNPQLTTQAQKIDHVVSFLKSHTQNISELTTAEKQSVNSVLEQYKGFVVHSNVYNFAFGFEQGVSKNRIETMYDDALASNMIDAWEHSTIIGLIQISKQAMDNVNGISIATLRNYVANAKSEYQNRGYTENT